MVDLQFECTKCGACCRDTLIGLTVDEGLRWANRGGVLGYSADIIIDDTANEVDPISRKWVYDNTTPARSGKREILVQHQLYAVIQGACPNLVDNICSIYDERPTTCAVYPAEVNDPLDRWEIEPGNKACPAEAWQRGAILANGPQLRSDLPERALIAQFQRQRIADQSALDLLRRHFEIKAGHLIDKTRMIYLLPMEKIADVLSSSREVYAQGRVVPDGWWQIFEEDSDRFRNLRRANFFAINDEKRLPLKAVLSPV